MTQVSAPSIAALKDVRVTPYCYKRPLFLGGIDATVAPPESRMRRGHVLRDAPVNIPEHTKRFLGRNSLPYLKGRYLFGGPMWGHFGHFFVDCIHRLWALKAGGESYDGIVFLAVQGLEKIRTSSDLSKAKPPAFLRDLMRLLDMPPAPVFLIREPTTIDRLDVPPAGTAPRNDIASFYRFYLDQYQQSLSEKLAVYIERAPERIYLGRRHLMSKGGILGCSYFERCMHAAGVYCATPEAMSLDQQIGQILGAKVITFDEGSAAHPTQVLSRIDTTFLMLPRRRKNTVYGHAISQRAPFSVLAPDNNIAVLPDRFGSSSSPGGMAVYIDPRPVFQKLKRHGFVEGPFDMDAFRAAEQADLAASNATTDETSTGRITALRDLRAG